MGLEELLYTWLWGRVAWLTWEWASSSQGGFSSLKMENSVAQRCTRSGPGCHWQASLIRDMVTSMSWGQIQLQEVVGGGGGGRSQGCPSRLEEKVDWSPWGWAQSLPLLFHATCQSWHVKMCLRGELVASVQYRPECKKRWAMGALRCMAAEWECCSLDLSRVGTLLILGQVQGRRSWCSSKPTHACTYMHTYTHRLSHTSPVHTHGYIHPGIYSLYTCKHTPHWTSLKPWRASHPFLHMSLHVDDPPYQQPTCFPHFICIDAYWRILLNATFPARQQHTCLPETIPAPCSSAPSPHNTHCNNSF